MTKKDDPNNNNNGGGWKFQNYIPHLKLLFQQHIFPTAIGFILASVSHVCMDAEFYQNTMMTSTNDSTNNNTNANSFISENYHQWNIWTSWIHCGII